jgi:hypothetical protein
MKRLLLLVFFSGIVPAMPAVDGRAEAPGREEALCDEIVTDLVPGVNRGASKTALAHVEVRRCAEYGGLQLVAWRASDPAPAIVLGLNRFSIGQMLVNKNVAAIVFPGGYDVIVVIQYVHGTPKVAFYDSTHSRIRLAGDDQQVIVTIDEGTGKNSVTKSFRVSDDDLAPGSGVRPRQQ